MSRRQRITERTRGTSSNIGSIDTTSRTSRNQPTIDTGRNQPTIDTGRRSRRPTSKINSRNISNIIEDFQSYVPIKQDIELECRYGINNRTGFTTKVHNSILPPGKLYREEIVDYISTDGYRLSNNNVIRKDRIFSRQYDSGHFTMRVSVSSEIEEPNITKNYIENNLSIIRKKERYNVQYNGCIVSITYVTTIRSGNQERLISELEVELLPESNIEQFMEVIVYMNSRLESWYNVMELYRNNMTNSKIIPIYTKFQGSMPISYKRSYNIHNYSIKYKLDGLRVNPIIIDNDMYLFTRNEGLIFTNIKINNTNIIGNYILDGEYIDAYIDTIGEEIIKDNNKHIVLFDIMYNGTNIMNQDYSLRYEQLKNFISNNDFNNPVILSPLLSINELQNDDIIENIEGEDRTIFITNISENTDILYLVDGYILQDFSSPYITGTDRNQYKWKAEDLTTVDFRSQYENNIMNLYLNSTAGEIMVTSTTQLNTNDFDTNYISGKIFEYYYDKNNGRWQILRERSDKTSPNFITVAFDVIESALDSITKEELISLYIDQNYDQQD